MESMMEASEMYRKYNILIADNNKYFLNAFKFYLEKIFSEKIGNICTTNNGNHALNLIKTNTFDIAFIALFLIGINGIEFTKKASELNLKLSIIAVLFSDELIFISEMIKAGAKNYIFKEEIDKKNLNKIFLIE